LTLIYRSVWRDDGVDAINLLEMEFRKWASEKTGLPVDQIPVRGTLAVTDNSKRIDVRRADTESGKAIQCTLVETDPKNRHWTTTAIAISVGLTQTFWIDVDCVDPHARTPEIASPRLVRQLLDRASKPVADGLIIATKVEIIEPHKARIFVEELGHKGRHLPIVVFSPDRRAIPKKTFDRAEAAAKALAGVAQVFVLTPRAEIEVQNYMPQGFWVYGGAVRLYVPPLDFSNPADAVRHPYLARYSIEKHPQLAASSLARRIAKLNSHPPVPSEWPELRRLLRRPSEDEIREQIERNRASKDVESPSPSNVDTEVLTLERLLAEADLMLAESDRKIQEQNVRMSELEDQHINDVIELQIALETIEDLQRNFRLMNLETSEVENSLNFSDPELVEAPEALVDVVELARNILTKLSIPGDADRDLDDLDDGHKGRVWAHTTWQGLLELHRYAVAKASSQFRGGFMQWCSGQGNWSVAKLAMSESETVKADSSLWDKRYFPVSHELSDSGRMHMEAHLKIQIGGGNSIPRLYFFDDTDGKTGLIHVGFVGPHYLVPNTKS
jgi:hypothetical protein